MNPGFRTYDAAGRETFNIFMSVIRQENRIYIGANTSGWIDLSAYLGGDCAVRFVPANYSLFGYVVAPYAYVNGNGLSYVNGGNAHYAIVTGVVR